MRFSARLRTLAARSVFLVIFLFAFQAAAAERPLSAQIERLDGTSNGELASLPRWRQAVFELRKKSAIRSAWPDARAIQESALSRVERNVIPLALVHALYEHEDEIGKRAAHRAFAFTPLRKVNYFPTSGRFSISHDSLFQHGDVKQIASLAFDAGDGNGYRPIEWDKSFPVRYAAGGVYTLKLRATLQDGSVLHSTSEIEVIDGAEPPPPTQTWDITATQEYMGVAGTGQAYLYLANGNTQLMRPVVVIEGFDIDNSIDWPVLYELLNQENLLEDLRTMGYDAVVLDFTEAVEPIQRNAFVFTRLVEMILDEVGPERSMALVGASMGGLVGRYGLLWMEDQEFDHQVRNFISFDTPHGGANIPLGLQHWLTFFADEAEEAQFFLDRLNSDAARQMLLYHVNSTSGTMANADPLLAAFNSDLAALGDWPQDPRLSTVINGSGSMVDQGFDAGDQIIEWEYNSLLVDITGNVWSVPDGGSQVIFDGEIDIIIVGGDSETTTIANTLPWDNAPGGLRPTMDQLAGVPAPYGDIVALHGAHSFIPSIAALALDTSDPFYDIAGDPLKLIDDAPFDQVYFPAENQEHIFITPENKDWFIFEIGFGLPSDIIQQDSFESP